MKLFSARTINRRRLLKALGGFAASVVVPTTWGYRVGCAASRALASQSLDIAYAGSMGALMEGPIKDAFTRKFGVEWHGRAQGSNALARLIEGGAIAPDVFIAVTPSPMRIVLRARKAASATPIARTEMVLAYSPASRFAEELARSGQPGALQWWQILERSGFRFGRTDPRTDPQGRNIIFTMELAAKYYRQPDMVGRILGLTINPQQIFPEPTVLARLQAGELDAASSYKIQPGPLNLPYVSLPPTLNLGSDSLQAQYKTVELQLQGAVYRPEPLVYYAAALTAAPHPQAAAAFVNWIAGREARTILRDYHYDAPGSSQLLRST